MYTHLRWEFQCNPRNTNEPSGWQGLFRAICLTLKTRLSVWHHFWAAELNTAVLKKCHGWWRHWKYTHPSEESYYFPYFFLFFIPTIKRLLKGCMADKLDATAGEFCPSSKVTCSKRHALCKKIYHLQLVWVQGRRPKDNRCWSPIVYLRYNQNPEKSKVQMTPRE